MYKILNKVYSKKLFSVLKNSFCTKTWQTRSSQFFFLSFLFLSVKNIQVCSWDRGQGVSAGCIRGHGLDGIRYQRSLGLSRRDLLLDWYRFLHLSCLFLSYSSFQSLSSQLFYRLERTLRGVVLKILQILVISYEDNNIPLTIIKLHQCSQENIVFPVVLFCEMSLHIDGFTSAYPPSCPLKDLVTNWFHLSLLSNNAININPVIIISDIILIELLTLQMAI